MYRTNDYLHLVKRFFYVSDLGRKKHKPDSAASIIRTKSTTQHHRLVCAFDPRALGEAERNLGQLASLRLIREMRGMHRRCAEST
jgi:hypothetical protein